MPDEPDEPQPDEGDEAQPDEPDEPDQAPPDEPDEQPGAKRSRDRNSIPPELRRAAARRNSPGMLIEIPHLGMV